VRFLVRCPAGATEQVSEESEALGWFRTDDLPRPLASGVLSQIEPALARLR
jgi:type IV secretory pathway protease TraF